MEVGIDRDQALFRILNGSALSIRVFGREYLIDEAGLSLSMPAAGRLARLVLQCMMVCENRGALTRFCGP